MKTKPSPSRVAAKGTPAPPAEIPHHPTNAHLPTVTPSHRRLEISIPTVTILKVFAALLIAYALYVLWPLVLLVFLALFLAVTLHSFVDRLSAKGMKRWLSLWIVIGSLWVALGVGAALLVPAMMNQVTGFSHNFPRIRDDALGQLPADGCCLLYTSPSPRD